LRKGRLIALGVAAAVAAAFAVPAMSGAEGPVSLAKNAMKVGGYAVSKGGEKPRSLVPTDGTGKLPKNVMNFSSVPAGQTITGVIGLEFIAATACNNGGSYSGTNTTCTNNTWGASASFPLKAPSVIKAENVGIVGGLNENPECFGSYDRPSAAPGYLCIYPGNEQGFFERVEAEVLNVSKNGDGAYAVEAYPFTGRGSQHGFRISVVPKSTGPTKFYATWAYTAPGGTTATADQ
jgi:hypothetical protein